MADQDASVWAELLAAAKDMLLGGAHDGPCDSLSDYDSCDRHIAMSDARRGRLWAATEAADKLGRQADG